ncbi:hypothetical protein OKA04_13140 [Luteolibacter flavescens]|uniref:Uncharacterized protein n=1 Tax=Luteolibacter flavescens TaxID=1859460 RepID=A0ABT3FQ32_9BACT|nr:hypothetical protein [Luteolibacter flavescens]MCW1885678.1 hypothetical protein [Luteolibacter flavescens]
MKALCILLAFVSLSVVAPAANLAFKNDTGSAQRVVVYQDGKVAGYVDRLKPGKTFLVKVKDTGNRPVVCLKVAGKDEYLFLPLKTKAYKLSWLRNLLW